MDRHVRYQRLPSEEQQQPAPTLETTDISENHLTEDHSPESEAMASQLPPPPFEEGNGASNSQVEPPKYDPNAPPSYTIATELPTYDQVQQFKLEEPIQDNTALDPETLERGDALLGTDFMFLCSFFVAFLFNWIGFLMLMCFCPTIAGRYGALAGFGLSLAKWTLIVKHSTDLISTDNNWLWWLILAFGILICVRAVLQYLHVKREWHLLTRVNQQRLMYFY